MDTKVLSPGVRYSNLPESYVRPESDRPSLSEVSARYDVRDWGDFLRLHQESYVRPDSDRPRLSEVSACDNVRNWGDCLRLSNPPDFNSRKGEHFYNKESSEASDEGGPFQVPASDYKSSLDSSVHLDRIRKGYKIPNDFILRVPDYVHNTNVCLVNKGDIVLYEADLKAGLRLPFHPFIGELLRRLGLAPGQLVPNAWMIVVFCLKLWQRFSEESAELSVDEFLYCYQLRKVPKSSSHWCFVARDNDTKLGIKLPSSNGSWKSNYFVVRGEALLEGVNCSWGDPNKFDRPNLDDFHVNRVKKAVEFSSRDHNSKRIDSEKKAKLPILRKRKASSELPSQESSANSVEALPVVDGPPRPSKGKEVLIEQDVTDDFPSMIRNLCHLVEEGTKFLAKLSVMGNEDLEKATAIKDVVMKKVEHLDSAERVEGSRSGKLYWEE